MSEFIRFVLWELRNSIALVILATIFGTVVLLCGRFMHRKKYGPDRKYPWGRTFLWLAFAGYCAIVLYATLFRHFGGYRQVNPHLFRAWREAWNYFSVKNWANVLLNIAMFMPLGVLLPLIGKKFRNWYATIPAGFLASSLIELIQLAAIKGICDVDDLFCNGLGCAIGYFLVMTMLSARRGKGKGAIPALIYGCLALTCVSAIGCVFVAYHFREYGNLPDAASYTIHTKGVEWSLDCELPDIGETAFVYRTQTRSKEACDAFAEDFRKIIDTEYNTISYYQEAAYYMDHSSDGGAHFLHVNYLNQGYDYSALYEDDPVWLEADRETVEEALGKYPLHIPEQAEFAVLGDGWYLFTADQQMDGEILFDGALRTRLDADGIVWEIENGLLCYTYYKEAGVISPKEAYALLRAGKFRDSDFFEMKNPSKISVVACKMEYRIDTKGFYQPVYVFDVVSADGDYQNRAVIPAMQ